jgi:hypothetical protein
MRCVVTTLPFFQKKKKKPSESIDPFSTRAFVKKVLLLKKNYLEEKFFYFSSSPSFWGRIQLLERVCSCRLLSVIKVLKVDTFFLFFPLLFACLLVARFSLLVLSSHVL